MNEIETIISTISPRQVAEHFGFNPNSRGYIKCPFHNDNKNPNLRLFGVGKGFYCFDADTKIITNKGIMKIGELNGKQTTIVNAKGEWEDTIIKSYGKQRLYEISISRDGIKKKINATGEHLWFVHKIGEVETKQLQPNTYLESGTINTSQYNIIEEAVIRGFVYGDGCINRITPNTIRYRTYLYDDKKINFMKKFIKKEHSVPPSLRNKAKLCFMITRPVAENYKKVIDHTLYDNDYIFSWLLGLFAADGSCISRTKSQSFCVNSSKKEDIEKIKFMFWKLGFPTTDIKIQKAKTRGTSGVVKDFKTDIFAISIYGKFLPNIFAETKGQKKINPKYARMRYKVLSVKPLDVVKEVYCCETSTQSFLLDNFILTHNCYACNTGGSVVNFVAKLLNIKNNEAAKELDRVFGLRLYDQKHDESFGERQRKIEKAKRHQEKLKKERERKEQERLEAFDKYLDCVDLIDKINNWLTKHKLTIPIITPNSMELELGFKIAKCQAKLNELDYLADYYYEKARKK